MRVRQTTAITRDPTRVLAIAPIKMVAEEIVQAIAFGDPDGEPRIITRWNPLSRDAGGLEVFAVALDDYVQAVVDGQLPRFWLPHKSALTLVDLLGYRYRTNQSATDTLRRMGWQCRAIADEATYQGQQAVVVATDLLRAHVVTGQAPVKDGHLGAMLAWVAPVPGRDPAEVADERALVPASGVVDRARDDEVERLRRDAKRGTGQAAARARSRIEVLLAEGAKSEWDLLVQARRAFWTLDLPEGPGLTRLVSDSRDRLIYRLRQDLNPPSMPDSLAHLVDEHEHAAELAEDADVRGDQNLRERARRKGRAVLAEVIAVNQPRPSCKPTRLTLRTTQEVSRVRSGTVLSNLRGDVAGRVEEVMEDATGTLLRIDLIKGVRRSTLPAVGDVLDWLDSVPKDLRFQRSTAQRAMRAAASPLVYGQDVAGSGATMRPPVDLLAVAERLRRRP